MAPPPRRPIAGTAAWHASMVPVRLTVSTRFQQVMSVESRSPLWEVAAALTSRSSPPNAASAVATALRAVTGWVMSPRR